MTDPKFATGESQPINRTGVKAAETFEEGDLVTVQADGSGGEELVAADASNGVPATGVSIGPVADPDALSNQMDNLARDVTIANRTTIGQRLAFARYGVEVENVDEDWGFTPNEPVYLDAGGGFTQTEPASSGDVVQVVGVAVTPERVFLDVEADYTTVA